MFKTNELKFLWKFYLVSFLQHLFGLAAIIWIVYFAQKGFSFTEISISLAIFSAGIFLFEVPTGVIADIFGRKKSVFLSFILLALLSLLAPFIASFWQLCILYLFWAFSLTLSSGADEAWVIDHLHKNKRKDLVDQYYSKSIAISQLGLFLAGLFLTTLLFFFKDSTNFLAYDKLWFVQAVGMFIVSLVVLSIPEHFKKQKTKISLLNTLHFSKSGFSYIKNHKTLSKIFITILIFSFASSIWFFAYQPFLLDSGFQIKDFGWARSVVSVGGILTALFAGYLVSKFKNKHILLGAAFLFRFLLATSILFIFGKVAGFIFYFLLWNHSLLIFPILNPLVQSYIPSKQRATIGSIKSMFVSVGDISALIIAGLLVDSLGTTLTIFISGLFIIPIIWIYFKLK